MAGTLYPIFLDLCDKKCVVVGAGHVAERRALGLLEAQANVMVVGIEATAKLIQLGKSGTILLCLRPFESGDLDGCFLAIAATDCEGVNREVEVHAHKKGILFCGADAKTKSDFQVPAVVRRGALQIAISTGGASPAYAKLLRAELEAWLGAEHAAFLDMLAKLRPRIHARFPNDEKKRQQVWQSLVNRETLILVRQGHWNEIEERIHACLLS